MDHDNIIVECSADSNLVVIRIVNINKFPEVKGSSHSTYCGNSQLVIWDSPKVQEAMILSILERLGQANSILIGRQIKLEDRIEFADNEDVLSVIELLMTSETSP